MIGDKDDIVHRQRVVLPPWFPDLERAPILKALLSGVGGALAFVYDLYTYAQLQTRIKTATGGWLDLIGWDFFAGRFVRRNGEVDDSWRVRIVKEILRPRQTKAAIEQALTDLTSRKPLVLEFFNPADMGGYDVPIGGYGVGTLYYGDLVPNRIFITAYRAPTQGVPNAGGYDTYNAGYDTGIQEYVDPSFVSGPITDADIYRTIAETTAAGIVPWTALQN